MKKLLFTFFLTALSLLLSAQTGMQSVNKQAQKNYEQAGRYISLRNYEQAEALLREAVKADDGFAAAWQQLGDINRRLKKYREAAASYRKVLSIDPNFHRLTLYGLAESELNLGDYAGALVHFEQYAASSPSLPASSKKQIEKYIADCRFGLEAVKHPVEFKPVNLGPAINSSSDEYLPVITADKERMIFTRRSNNNEDFYESVRKNGQWTQATYLSHTINTPNLNEGAQCISPDGLYLFFTGCNRPDGLGRCDIYVSKREGRQWSKPFNIGPPINTAGWESQPSLSADGHTLYFVSNRPGGLGGNDIWMSELLPQGGWSAPVNLGPEINTPYDEHSPFIHPDNSTLYFSSNGWPGMGNRDLFMSRRDSSGKWQKPQNLGYPVNTAGEESSLTVTADGTTGFFASDMKGGYGGMDIYSFSLHEQARPLPVTYVKGTVTDAGSKRPLSAQVRIVELKSGIAVFDEDTDPEDGTFLATMPAGKNYGLTIYKEGYLFYSENFSPETVRDADEAVRLSVGLQKIQQGGVVILKNIFFGVNKADLLPESKAELLQLIVFLRHNPGVRIEIGGHTDNTGSDELNAALSESRALSVYNYLISNKIPASILSYKGYGKSQPAADNSTEEGRRTNRRTEFRIISYQ